MTDNEIIKALECCSKKTLTYYPCNKCPLNETECLFGACLIPESLDLINRQKAEIDRFADIGKMYSEIKSEAIKEFAERVKDIVDEPELIRGRVIDNIIAKIDNLVKEMTEERK